MGTIEQKRKAMLLMAMCATLWSIAGIFIKWISWNPLLIAGARSLIGAVVLGLFMWKTGTKIKLNKYSILAGFGLSGTCISFVIANKMTTAANAIVLQSTAPIFILLFSAFLFKKKMKRSDVSVVIVVTLGIAAFFFDKLSPGNIIGNFLGITAGFCLAVMLVSVGQAADDDSVRMTGVLLAHILTTTVGASSLFFVDFHTTPIEVVYVMILGVFQLGIPYVFYCLASKHCSPLACSLIGMLEPLLNPVWVFLFAGEAPGFFALIGGAVVIFAVSAWCVSENRRIKNIEPV